MTAPRVLVVDDEKLIRWSLGERLSRSGYEVAAAESGEEALDKLRAGAPDVMLLDVRLPGIDGLDTLRHALALQPELVVLMMSAHGTVDIAVEGMKRGAIDFLVKPFPLGTLDVAVKRALDAAATRRAVAAPQCDRCSPACSAGCIVGDSVALGAVRDILGRVAASNTGTVLIEGESGVGKEVAARCIHFQSGRSSQPFLCVNCAALPEQLLESELFGHERGAFTDARVAKQGIFEAAEGGTVMLDEIGDLAASGQAKLLRLLENHTFRRVGGVQEVPADVRVVAATNVDLEERVAQGRFRADLYFRLNVVRVRIPPLREHIEDVPQIAAALITRYGKQSKAKLRGISASALDLMMAYRWPGNVRELRNLIERALILHGEVEEIRPEHLPASVCEQSPLPSSTPPPPPVLQLEEMEKRLITEALRKSNGNQSQAARLLGVTRDTLRYRLKKHVLE